MKVVILCGGKGTRLREETSVKPKPMVEIGGRPVLWHIMSIYARFGFKDFILPLGYKGRSLNSISTTTISAIRILLWTSKAARSRSTPTMRKTGG